MKLVEVRWRDSATVCGWHDLGEIVKPVTCRTVGYLIHRDKRQVIIARDVNKRQWGEAMSIPTAVVRSIRRVRL